METNFREPSDLRWQIISQYQDQGHSKNIFTQQSDVLIWLKKLNCSTKDFNNFPFNSFAAKNNKFGWKFTLCVKSQVNHCDSNAGNIFYRTFANADIFSLAFSSAFHFLITNQCSPTNLPDSQFICDKHLWDANPLIFSSPFSCFTRIAFAFICASE